MDASARPPVAGGRSAVKKQAKIGGIPRWGLYTGGPYGDTCEAWPPKTHRSGAHAEHERRTKKMKRPSREARIENTPSAVMVAKAMEDYVHTVAHAEAWRLSEECRQIIDATNAEHALLAERVDAIELKNENLAERIGHQVSDAIANMETPEHISQSMADLEQATEANMDTLSERIDSLESKLSELIAALGAIANIE